MTSIVGISGSLRRESYNTKLLHAANDVLPDGATLTILSIIDIPLYNGDVEFADGVPPAVTKIKEAIAAADALLISTPEYNNSVPGVLKNAVDWLSRPNKDIPHVFGNKATAIMGATPGGFGTVLAQAAWLPVLRTLETRYFTPKMLVSGAGKAFDDDGLLTDTLVRERLVRFLADFVEFART
jgi:NAD(P)H-dependent FMN reductase